MVTISGNLADQNALSTRFFHCHVKRVIIIKCLLNESILKTNDTMHDLLHASCYQVYFVAILSEVFSFFFVVPGDIFITRLGLENLLKLMNCLTNYIKGYKVKILAK